MLKLVKPLLQLCLFCLTLSINQGLFAQQIKATTTNTTPPTFSLIGVDYRGTKVDLRDYSGKTILISFYSASCSVCARDLKLMREFYRDNQKRNFVLIGVNTDKTLADFAFYTKILTASIPKNQQFPIIWQGNAEKIDGFGTMNNDPTHYLVMPNGQLSLKRAGTFKAEDWDNLWESLNP